MFKNLSDIKEMFEICRLWIPQRKIVFTTEENAQSEMLNQYDKTMYTVVAMKNVIEFDMTEHAVNLIFLGKDDLIYSVMHFGEFSIENIKGKLENTNV